MLGCSDGVWVLRRGSRGSSIKLSVATACAWVTRAHPSGEFVCSLQELSRHCTSIFLLSPLSDIGQQEKLVCNVADKMFDWKVHSKKCWIVFFQAKRWAEAVDHFVWVIFCYPVAASVVEDIVPLPSSNRVDVIFSMALLFEIRSKFKETHYCKTVLSSRFQHQITDHGIEFEILSNTLKWQWYNMFSWRIMIHLTGHESQVQITGEIPKTESCVIYGNHFTVKWGPFTFNCVCCSCSHYSSLLSVRQSVHPHSMWQHNPGWKTPHLPPKVWTVGLLLG